MAVIIFKNQEQWVAAMEKAASYTTTYKNKWPYNLLYWDGTTLSADCVNLQKALFNGGDVFNLQKGRNQGKYWSGNTGDCTEWGLLTQCTDISTDFSKLKAGYPEILYMDGHIGAYLGKEIIKNGYVYNVIEATAWSGDFGHSGIIYTYVDQYGRRFNHHNGRQLYRWLQHGKPTKWVTFVAPSKKETLAIDGDWGINTTKATQKFLGTKQDGLIFGQPQIFKKYCPACSTKSWTFINSVTGSSNTIKALQKWLGMKESQCDGRFGPITIRAFQNKIGAQVDGECGPYCVKAWQKYLNEHM